MHKSMYVYFIQFLFRGQYLVRHYLRFITKMYLQNVNFEFIKGRDYTVRTPFSFYEAALHSLQYYKRNHLLNVQVDMCMYLFTKTLFLLIIINHMTLQYPQQVSASSQLTRIGTLTQLHGTFNKTNFITLGYFWTLTKEI